LASIWVLVAIHRPGEGRYDRKAQVPRGAWRRYNSLEWIDHSASECLARNRAGRTLEAVQPLFLA